MIELSYFMDNQSFFLKPDPTKKNTDPHPCFCKRALYLTEMDCFSWNHAHSTAGPLNRDPDPALDLYIDKEPYVCPNTTMLKGLFTDFTGSSPGIQFTFSVLNFLDPCGRNGQFNGGTDRSEMVHQ